MLEKEKDRERGGGGGDGYKYKIANGGRAYYKKMDLSINWKIPNDETTVYLYISLQSLVFLIANCVIGNL